MKWCPKCKKMVYAVNHQFPELCQTESRCLECGLTLEVLHYGHPAKKKKVAGPTKWE